MEIVYPPVGIAHIIGQIPDLIADRMTTASRIRVACAMQPKAAPHFGTGIVILSAFTLARLFQDTFGKPATVLLDMLDNAPARTTVIDGVEYSIVTQPNSSRSRRRFSSRSARDRAEDRNSSSTMGQMAMTPAVSCSDHACRSRISPDYGSGSVGVRGRGPGCRT